MKFRIIKRICVFALILCMISGGIYIPVSADGNTPQRSANVILTLDPQSNVTDPYNDVDFTLTVEGLGTDPADNQISSAVFSSSDTNVAITGGVSGMSTYTPYGGDTPTGLMCTATVSTLNAGISFITATVTDIDGKTYTTQATLTVSGLVIEPRDITLEVGEACVLYVKRYGFSSSQAATNLKWTKNPGTGWIGMGTHYANAQREAYYISGQEVGTGTVTAALSNIYSDTVNVTVIPGRAVTIMNDYTEVASPIDLSGAVSETELEAVPIGFDVGLASVSWESSRPDIVSVTAGFDDRAVIRRESYSDTSVAIKATVTDGIVTRTKTVYVSTASAEVGPALNIVSKNLTDGKNITIYEGETVSLSAKVLGLDASETVWSATTDGGRVPVKLNSTVGKNITITGRSSTNDPVMIVAENEGSYDTVYVTVKPSGQKSVKITGADLGADGVISLLPGSVTTLSAELTGFGGEPAVTWNASVAKNNDNSNGTGICPVGIINNFGISATVTANETSADFAKITVIVSEGSIRYTDEILVKATGCDIIKATRSITMFSGDSVTLQTVDGNSALWTSTSQKTPVGFDVGVPTTATGASTIVSSLNNQITKNPSKITAEKNGITDTVYVNVARGSWQTVSFDLNGGFGKTPDSFVISSNDTSRSIILKAPDASYPSDDGEYVFYGWSEYANAGDPDTNREIYLPDQTYSLSSGATSKTLYAIWAKKTEDVLFKIRLSGDIGAEPGTQQIGVYAKSNIYIKDALSPAGFYFNVNGIDDHLLKIPSDTDIVRVLSLEGSATYDPQSDRIIWYVVKRLANDGAGLTNWRVDGVLVKEGKVTLTYDKNLPTANIDNMINPPCAIFDIGETVCITNTVPSCSDASFIGWNTKPDGTGQWYRGDGSLYEGFPGVAETSFVITEDTTLYAIWTGTNVRVDWVGGDHPDKVNVILGGQEYVLSGNNGWCMHFTGMSSDEDPVQSPLPLEYTPVTDKQVISSGTDGFGVVTYTITNTFVPSPPGLKFSNVSLTLQNNLKINFKAGRALFETSGYSDPYVVFETDGKRTRVEDYTVDGDFYVFSFGNIAPDRMTDDIKVTLHAKYAGKDQTSAEVRTSIAEYCRTLLDKTTDADAKLRTLLVDLLNYGAASQTYTNYNTAYLANEILSPEQSAYGTYGDPVLTSVTTTHAADITDPSASWKAVALRLNDSITMQFAFTVSGTTDKTGITVEIRDGVDGNLLKTVTEDKLTVADGFILASYSGLGAGQMKTPVFVTVKQNDTVISNTLRYSIESYACAKKNSADVNLANLVIAMMKYGNSAYDLIY